MTHTKDTPKCPNCGGRTIPDTNWKLTPSGEAYYKKHPDRKPILNYSGCPVCGREDTPKETWEEINKVHSKIIEEMKKAGWGLLTDGDTFYQLGYELDPRNSITFTMNQAYAIVRILVQARQDAVREVVEKIEANKITDLPDTIRIESSEIPDGDIVEGFTYNAIIDQLIATLKEGKEEIK